MMDYVRELREQAIRRYSGQVVVTFKQGDRYPVVLVETPGGCRVRDLYVHEALRQYVDFSPENVDNMARHFIEWAIQDDEAEATEGLVEEGRRFVEPTIRTERWACFTLNGDSQEIPYVGRSPEERWPTSLEVDLVSAAGVAERVGA